MILRPEAVVTEDDLGSKVLTFSGMCARCEGMSESSLRRVSSLAFRPAPTRVLYDGCERPDRGPDEDVCIPSRLFDITDVME